MDSLSVLVAKDGQTYECVWINKGLWWCGCCNKAKIRVYPSREWERVSEKCSWCGAKCIGGKQV